MTARNTNGLANGKTLWTILLLASASAGVAQNRAQPQGATSTLPSFDVVSVKHSGQLGNGRQLAQSSYQGGRLVLEESLGDLLRTAYKVEYRDLVGPDWLFHDIYDIRAIAPPDTNWKTVRMMLQTMLAERLALKYHLDERVAPIYALVVGKEKLGITIAVSQTEKVKTMGTTRFTGASSLATFVQYLSANMDRPVLDMTGLQGVYDFDLNWQPEYDEMMRESGHSDPQVFFWAVRLIGLNLEPRKAPMKIMVIDHVNKEPTPN